MVADRRRGRRVPFGLFFGRLANFINGELFGRVTDVPWAMVFRTAAICRAIRASSTRRGWKGIVLFLVLRLLTHRYHKLATRGFVSGGFCAGYGVARTFVEFFREPDIQIGYLAGGLTMGMLLSIPMILFGIGLMIWASRRPAATTEDVTPLAEKLAAHIRAPGRSPSPTTWRSASPTRSTATTCAASRSAAPATSSPRRRSARSSAS